MSDRVSTLLGDVGRNCKVLELGPSMSPMAPRSAGWDVTVVDHASQADLVEKYRGHPGVDVSKIEEVDIVWTNGPLHEAVPEHLHGRYNMLIASHVIEHLPDMVGFLKSASVLLNPQHGILALAVPDKRLCFDCLKPVSTTGEVLASHRLGAQRHALAPRFDHLAYSVSEKGRTAWIREPLEDFKFIHSLEEAQKAFESWSDDPNAPYVDTHAWQFTPASFELLILELGCLGIINWRVSWLAPQPGVEFLVHLVPGREVFDSATARDNRRIELLKRALLDVREQTDWLLSTSVAAVQQPEKADPVVATSALDEETRHQIRQISETAEMVRSALRPGQVVWHRMLPVRRVVAKLRGRA